MSHIERITVVVPAFDEELLIPHALDALTHQKTDTKYHIVVVDNGSADNTVEIASSYSNVTVLHEPVKGTGYAANTGFRYALAEDAPLCHHANRRRHSPYARLD